jgi:hypothetical protein
VLDEARHTAAAASAVSTSGTTVAPAIDSGSDAQDEADRLNLINQAVIGAIEGTAKAITAKVSSDVTNAILQTADGSDFKSTDNWQLKEVIATVVQGADRPNTADVLSHLLTIIRFSFDFCKKVSANMELLRSKAGCMQSYGIAIDATQLSLVLLANIDLATGKNWGHEFCSTLQSIQRKYTYNYTHTTASITNILKELASADGVRKLTDAPTPCGHASAVTDQVSLLARLLHQQTPESDVDVTEGASAALSDIKSSHNKSCHGRCGGGVECNNTHHGGQGQCSRSCHLPNSCPHCKKFARRKPHPNIPDDKCFWNKKFEGFHAK